MMQNKKPIYLLLSITCLTLALLSVSWKKPKNIRYHREIDFKNIDAFVQQEQINTGNEVVDAYIRRYLKVCLVEQNKFNIPASIKFAQAIREGNCGRSFLAKNAKNHFGIKSFNRKDRRINRHDDRATDHFHVKSTNWESFRQHSLLLSNPEGRYYVLFKSKFDKDDFIKYRKLTDNKGKRDKNFNLKLKRLKKYWPIEGLRFAYGLDILGYATDNKYAFNLENDIKKYHLQKWDKIKIIGIPNS